MLFVLSDNKIKNKNSLVNRHVLPSSSNRNMSSCLIPLIHSSKFFSRPLKLKFKTINYEKTIDCLPSILPLMGSVIYLKFVRKEYELNKNRIIKKKIIFTYRISRSRFLLLSSALHLLSETQSWVRPSSSSQPGKKDQLEKSLHEPSGHHWQNLCRFL